MNNAEEGKAEPPAELKAEEDRDFKNEAVQGNSNPTRPKLKNATQMLLAPLKVTEETPQDKEQKRRQKLLEFDPRV